MTYTRIVFHYMHFYPNCQYIIETENFMAKRVIETLKMDKAIVIDHITEIQRFEDED